MSQQAPQRNDDQNILAVTVVFGIVIALLFIVFLNQPVTQAPPTPTPEPTLVAEMAQPTAVAAEPTAEMVAGQPDAGQPVSYTEAQVAAGQRIFGGLCFACHGQGGVGITGLGKPLVDSEFVNGMTDAELVAFLEVGRQPTDPLNSTGQLMPAKGGNPALTEEDLYNVVAYMRVLNGAPVEGAAPEPTANPDVTPTAVRRPANASNWTPPVLGGGSAPAEATAEATPEPTVAPAAEATTAPVSETPATTVSAEARLYAQLCASCHGAAGEGVGGQAALVGVESDWDAFVQEITVPVPVGTVPTGFVHPFRGGFPALTDEQIAGIVAYVQSLGG
jgi:disulfide bond formation protein DsbB